MDIDKISKFFASQLGDDFYGQSLSDFYQSQYEGMSTTYKKMLEIANSDHPLSYCGDGQMYVQDALTAAGIPAYTLFPIENNLSTVADLTWQLMNRVQFDENDFNAIYKNKYYVGMKSYTTSQFYKALNNTLNTQQILSKALDALAKSSVSSAESLASYFDTATSKLMMFGDATESSLISYYRGIMTDLTEGTKGQKLAKFLRAIGYAFDGSYQQNVGYTFTDGSYTGLSGSLSVVCDYVNKTQKFFNFGVGLFFDPNTYIAAGAMYVGVWTAGSMYMMSWLKKGMNYVGGHVAIPIIEMSEIEPKSLIFSGGVASDGSIRALGYMGRCTYNALGSWAAVDSYLLAGINAGVPLLDTTYYYKVAMPSGYMYIWRNTDTYNVCFQESICPVNPFVIEEDFTFSSYQADPLVNHLSGSEEDVNVWLEYLSRVPTAAYQLSENTMGYDYGSSKWIPNRVAARSIFCAKILNWIWVRLMFYSSLDDDETTNIANAMHHAYTLLADHSLVLSGEVNHNAELMFVGCVNATTIQSDFYLNDITNLDLARLCCLQWVDSPSASVNQFSADRMYTSITGGTQSVAAELIALLGLSKLRYFYFPYMKTMEMGPNSWYIQSDEQCITAFKNMVRNVALVAASYAVVIGSMEAYTFCRNLLLTSEADYYMAQWNYSDVGSEEAKQSLIVASRKYKILSWLLGGNSLGISDLYNKVSGLLTSRDAADQTIGDSRLSLESSAITDMLVDIGYDAHGASVYARESKELLHQ